MRLNRLSARTVATLSKPGRHADGGDLYLTVDKSGNKRWIFMFVQRGKQHEAGLGGLNSVPLVKAREIAASFRAALAAGLNPIMERRVQRQLPQRKTFGQIAKDFLAAHEASWGNEKHKQQWRMTLEIYARPLWNLPVEQVDTAAVLAILQPLWVSKGETASRLRGRIEAILDAARVAGHIGANEANPARWKGHLDKLLPKQNKLTHGHHLALPYQDVPAFIQRLHENPSMAALALEFLILTAARTYEVLLATWPEMDLAAKVWIIPAYRMKAGREHRVPLSAPAQTILTELHQTRLNAFVFPGRRRSTSLGPTALIAWLHRLEINVTVHGFRSSFRDWAGDQTEFPHEICEAALAHTSGAVEQAYRRGDALEKRRVLMEMWGGHCLSVPERL